MQQITAKERMKIPRHPMVEQEPLARSQNFLEVNQGYTVQMAKEEALRCLQCPKPTCVEGCPVNIQIKDFINYIAQEDFIGAVHKIKEDNALPAICGRVCPQEQQCEQSCVVGKRGEPVAIGYLERFVADYERTSGNIELPKIAPPTGKKIAIVGSGPSGLSCANDLCQLGHDVTVFEALHQLGGVLVYGIPEFRLPKDIVATEIDGLRKMGVKFETDAIIGRITSIDELFEEEGFDAVFLGVGAGLPWFMGIPGENLVGVYSANEFLTRVNLMKAFNFPSEDTPILDCKDKNIAVFGGGNTAMDAVRVSKRLGAKHAYIIYRRSEKEMPARVEEVKHARQEGVEFLLLTSPLEFVGDEDEWLQAVKVQKMELGEPDASGRRRPVPIDGSEYSIDLDIAIVAIGNGANPLIPQTTPDIEMSKRGTIVVDDETMKTSKKGVFAGGDIVTGGATVILAMGAGRKAAVAIHDFVMNGKWQG